MSLAMADSDKLPSASEDHRDFAAFDRQVVLAPYRLR
jgi:hypothetical protein